MPFLAVYLLTDSKTSSKSINGSLPLSMPNVNSGLPSASIAIFGLKEKKTVLRLLKTFSIGPSIVDANALA